ncbi:MAG: glycosyltransferase family 2 protein [Patescibacteria group bacterium]
METSKEYPLVSAVIFCWNRKDDLRITLEKVQDNPYPNLEIIVVDNGSTDGTAQMVKEQFPKARLTCLPENIGIAAGNVGFKQAKGKYILVLDDDSYPASKAIFRSIEEMEKDRKLGIVTFNIYDPTTNQPIPRSHRPPSAVPVETFSFTGCGVILRKDVFSQVGFYPEENFLYQNELQPSVRILDMGYKIKFYPEIIAYHKFSPKHRANKRDILYGTRNNLLFIWKHLPFIRAIITSNGVLFIYGARALKSFLIIDYLKAVIGFFAKLPLVIRERKVIRPKVVKMLTPYYRENSIIDFIARHGKRNE